MIANRNLSGLGKLTPCENPVCRTEVEQGPGYPVTYRAFCSSACEAKVYLPTKAPEPFVYDRCGNCGGMLTAAETKFGCCAKCGEAGMF